MRFLYKTPENIHGNELVHDGFSHMSVDEAGSAWAVFESECEARNYAVTGKSVWFEPIIVVVAMSTSPMDILIA